MKRVVMAGLLLVFCSLHVSAQQMYVSGVRGITFRTGPGTDHKILRSVKPGTPIEIIEKGDEWTKLKMSNGQEGWMLNMFITSAMPEALLLQRMKKKYDALSKEHAELKKSSSACTKTNSRLTTEFASREKELEAVSSSYDELKKGSANYLKLKSDYAKSAEELSVLRGDVEMLKEQLTKKNVWWFFGGAGVLLLGMIMGSSVANRKKKYLYS